MTTTDQTNSDTVVSSTQATLRYIFTIVPIVAGADKFLNLLADWESYLSPFVLNVIPVSAATFMYAVGIIEIVAGYWCGCGRGWAVLSSWPG